MKVMILGGLGFIGSNLVEALFDVGSEVLVVDRGSESSSYNVDRLKWASVPLRLGPPQNGKVGAMIDPGSDVREFENLRIRILQFNPDVIINCASEASHPDWDVQDRLESIAQGTDNLLQIRREQSVLLGKAAKLIHISGSAQLDPASPAHFYAETLLAAAQENDNLGTIVVLRPCSPVYGPGQCSTYGSPICALIRSDDPVPVQPHGETNPIYIKDLSDIVVQLSTNRHNLPRFSLLSVDGPLPSHLNREIAALTGFSPSTEFAKGIMLSRDSLKYK